MEKKTFPEGLTRHLIKFPNSTRRLIYGFDPDTKEMGWTGYYIELKDSNTGQIVLSAGFSENLESGDFLSSLEDILPMKIGDEDKEKLEEHKINIAAGLPF